MDTSWHATVISHYGQFQFSFWCWFFRPRCVCVCAALFVRETKISIEKKRYGGAGGAFIWTAII